MPDLRLQEPKRHRNGTGSVVVRGDVYHGKWRGSDGRQLMRRLGRVRQRGARDGLTRAQAERELRGVMSEVQSNVSRDDPAHDRASSRTPPRHRVPAT